MHNTTLILPITWYFENKAWSVFNEISLEALPSCIKLWNFGVFSQNFGNTRPKMALMMDFAGF